jgi:hypothetical protein
MTRAVIFVFIVISLSGCDPIYQVLLVNKSADKVYVITKPGLEEIYAGSTYYDSIVRVKVKNDDSLSKYLIEPNQVLKIFDDIGGKPTVKKFPFEYIQILKFKDTITLDSKQTILNNLITDKQRKYLIVIK